MDNMITPFAFFYNLQGWEILLIVFAILLLFGAKKLPELAKGIGKAIHEFKRAATNAEDTFREAVDTSAPAKTAPEAQKCSTEKAAETSGSHKS